MSDTFSRYHPVVNFLFFALAILFGMLIVHPAYVLSALIAMGAVKVLSRFVILYGRRKFAVYLIIGILEKILFTYLYFGNSYMFYNLSMTIGYLVPGILGREMEKQGIAKTLGALTVVVLLVRMLQVLLT